MNSDFTGCYKYILVIHNFPINSSTSQFNAKVNIVKFIAKKIRKNTSTSVKKNDWNFQSRLKTTPLQ